MTTIKSILEDDARALDAETLDAIARDAGNRAYCEPLRAEEIFKEALEAATVLERERGNAWRAAHDVVKLELDRVRAMRCGHTSYGEGAISDGPGAPLSPNLIEHIDALDALVARLVKKHTLGERAAKQETTTRRCTECGAFFDAPLGEGRPSLFCPACEPR